MKRETEKNRIYNIGAACKKAIKAQKLQGHESIVCSAILSRRGKKVNGIDRASSDNFSRLLISYYDNENPDKIRVELRNSGDELLWTKIFNIDQEPELPLPTEAEFRGLGEAEVNQLLNTKLEEHRKNQELQELRSLRDELEQENDTLKKELEEVQSVVEAKKNIEYYSNIIGLALPGLAKVMSKTALGDTLGLLAGVEGDEDKKEASAEEKDQRETIIELVSEFMRGLDDAQLGQLYLVFIELSNNPALINTLLSHLTTQKQ